MNMVYCWEPITSPTRFARRATLLALTCCLNTCAAAREPAVGLLQIHPVIGDGINITARPMYVMTAARLAAPMVFSGLQDAGGRLRVICCYEVADIVPLDFK